MSSGMNVKEAEKIADKMSYREAIMNCLRAQCVPYRKATKIKMKRLLESIDNDKPLWKSDEHFINACNESYQQGAKEFAEWLCRKSDYTDIDINGFTTCRCGASPKDTTIEQALVEWQKGGRTMSSTQGHTNINTVHTTIDISVLLGEINRIADDSFLKGVKQGNQQGRAYGAREFAEWLQEKSVDNSIALNYGKFKNRDLDEVLAEWQKEGE